MSFNQFPEWWVFAVAIGLLFLFVYWDIKVRPARLRWARVSSLMFMILSLLMLYAKPFKSVNRSQFSVAIITDNADQQAIDSLKLIGFQPFQWSSTDVDMINDASQVVIVGDGLEPWELNQLDRIDDFIPSENEEEGVVDISYGNPTEQSILPISIRLNIDSSLNIVISGTGIETVEQETSESSLIVNVLPTIEGYLTYRLDGIRSGDTLFSEVIPVYVAAKKQANVLMLANTPSFEFRALKNHLAEEGFGIAERLRVSSDLYHEAFTNMDNLRLTTLSNQLLESFQLVVLNAVSYQGLRRNEKKVLKMKLRKGELGLVLIGVNGTFDLVKLKNAESHIIELQSKNGKIRLTDAESRMERNARNILFQNEVIGQTNSSGLGQIILPIFTDSYSIKLSGESKLYAALWQLLLNDAMGAKNIEEKIEVPDFPRVSEPTNITIRGVEKESQEMIEGIRLAAGQTWFDLDNWTVTYFPKKRGWHKFNELDEQFFVFDSSDYALQKRKQKRKQTASLLNKPTNVVSKNRLEQEPISKWIFFGLFLLGISFLWIEQRIG